MKLENYPQVKSIVDQIEKHEVKLKQLDDQINIFVSINGGGVVYTIGVDSKEHNYAPQARHLVESIQQDLKKRIEDLKTNLEAL